MSSDDTGAGAQILSGSELSKSIKEVLKQEVKVLKEKHEHFDPTLAIVQVGGREDSNVYIRMKKKVAAEIGVATRHVQLPRTTTENELLVEVEKLNNDRTIHGVIVQLPLDTDTPIDANRITNAVSPAKDVDGIHDENAGKLCHGQLTGFFIACTPMGCLELIKKSGVTIKGSRAVVIGRSKIVGSPMAQLLIWNHATVTICNSYTKDLRSIVKEADILVVAVGRAQMVKKDWIKPGAVVIDCGINSIPGATVMSSKKDQRSWQRLHLLLPTNHQEFMDRINPCPFHSERQKWLPYVVQFYFIRKVRNSDTPVCTPLMEYTLR